MSHSITQSQPEFATLDQLHHELWEMGDYSAEYFKKQVHVVPKSTTVDRTGYLVQQATAKAILHVGCTGALDVALRKAAKKCYGIDQQPLTRPDFYQCNLDALAYEDLPTYADVELVICGEVLEHLSNPGFFLISIREACAGTPVIFTVPNAMGAAGAEWLLKRGRENVHRDHVSYYSYTTLKTLLDRAGYDIVEHYWYGGKPYVSEGLIVKAIARAVEETSI